ncbi:Uncharacterized protein APZ42_016187 [Daphnia magna]|uniref:Uncharacterized protein n=1 Tax=Daphnia magna TaxID=35525 RepID=A0A165AJK5_9CRUS|nr:Uncharacterized protein APZ42_016187 [Daphnia magna]
MPKLANEIGFHSPCIVIKWQLTTWTIIREGYDLKMFSIPVYSQFVQHSMRDRISHTQKDDTDASNLS